MAVDDAGAALRLEAEALLERFKTPRAPPLDDARSLVKRLRSAREFEALTQVAEAVIREAPGDATTKRHYAQALIDTGHSAVAVDMLRTLTRNKTESAEAFGLIGRANKQIFFDAGDKSSKAARTALKDAIAAYLVPFKANPTNYWHGVNLVAVLTAARRLGVRVARDLEPTALARQLLEVLEGISPDRRDLWYHASVAEANLALGAWDEVESHLKLYLTDPEVDAFALGSTLRQFTEVWNLEADEERGRPLVAILRARTIRCPGGGLELAPSAMLQMAAAQPTGGQLEAVLGDAGPVTYQWVVSLIGRGAAVGAVRRKADGRRHGTCFLIKASSLGLAGDETLALTNHHVMNQGGEGLGIRPSAGEVQFEAAQGAPRSAVTDVVWSSPPEMLDASILRLANPPAAIEPLQTSRFLPVLDQHERVYLIGHPDGNELAISFQDNELLDHEGPAAGKPPIAGRVRIHYKAPTKGGSSGSPVLNQDLDLIGLHHFGGKVGVTRLNGKEGTYAANEGLWIQSIAQAPKQ